MKIDCLPWLYSRPLLLLESQRPWNLPYSLYHPANLTRSCLALQILIQMILWKMIARVSILLSFSLVTHRHLKARLLLKKISVIWIKAKTKWISQQIQVKLRPCSLNKLWVLIMELIITTSIPRLMISQDSSSRWTAFWLRTSLKSMSTSTVWSQSFLT